MDTQPQRAAWQLPAGLPQAADEHWTYLLDDTGIVYGPGWWPFYGERRWPSTGGASGTATPSYGIRLAPDVAFYAWHTEYLALYPTDEPGIVHGACYITPRDGSRHHAKQVIFQLRMRGDQWTADPIGEQTHDADVLTEKTRRAIEFLQAAIAERDSGATRPTTAADRVTAAQGADPSPADPATS